MANTIVIRGESQRSYAIRYLTNLQINPDKPMEMTVEPYKKRRTNSQLALLWIRHAEISKAVADFTGHSPEDIHELLKAKFLKPRIVELGDTIVERYSTKGLTTAEMSAFMEQIEAWASSELGLLLAQPEDRMVA